MAVSVREPQVTLVQITVSLPVTNSGEVLASCELKIDQGVFFLRSVGIREGEKIKQSFCEN